MNAAVITALILSLLSLSGCQSSDPDGVVQPVNIPASAAQINDFQTRLNNLSYEGLGASTATSLSLASISSSEQNTLISLFDLTQAVAMIGWGARGDTATELAAALSLPQPQVYWASIFEAIGEQFRAAEGLSLDTQFWGQTNYPFSRGFIAALDGGHSAITEPLNFLADLVGETFSPITRWATDDPNQLLSAESFDWESPKERTRIIAGSRINISAIFDARAYTQQSGVFSDLNDRYWQMPMLRFQGKFDSFENDLLRAVYLPMKPEQGIRVLLLTPKPGLFGSVIEDLDNQVANLLTQLQPSEAQWWLPRLTLLARGERGEQLRAAGAVRAFSEEDADFSGINGDGYLYLKEIEQRSRLQITATGINASSVTLARAQAMLSEPVSYIPVEGGVIIETINIDVCITPPAPDAQPFILVLIDQSQQTPLFASKILNPGGVSIDTAYLGRTSDCLPTLPLFIQQEPEEVNIISAGNSIITLQPISAIP